LVNLQHLQVRGLLDLEQVHPDDAVLAPVNPGLFAGGRFFDAQLRQAAADRFGHASELLHLVHQRGGRRKELGGEVLDHARSGPRIHRLGEARFVEQEELCVAGDARRSVGGQGDGLVEGVRVQALGAAVGRGEGFERGPSDVVPGVLGGEGPAASLGVGA
jgi:hypothetical protein